MSAVNFLRYVHLAYASQPSGERVLYRAIRRLRATSIVEIGVGMGQRAARLIRVALRYAGPQRVRYTGIDLFEARCFDRPGWTIKRAHWVLTALGAKVQLVPGDPLTALARNANALTNTDLLVIDADQEGEALERAWFYVPRMLHERSRVFLEVEQLRNRRRAFRVVEPAEIDALAERAADDSRRAA